MTNEQQQQDDETPACGKSPSTGGLEGSPPIAWLYMHDGMMHDGKHLPVISLTRWRDVVEPWNEQALYLSSTGNRPYLAGGMRFKVSFSEDMGGCHLRGLPDELNGRWVAFVGAEDDCHLEPSKTHS